MVSDPAKFQPGDVVLLASSDALAEFARTWKLHHPLQPDQMAFSARQATVAESFMYHGGDILYRLEDIPGLWHEHLLAAV